jgi:hypothetical protein
MTRAKAKTMILDRYQGDDDQGRKFGYIHGDEGGYFFTHLESLDATIGSLEVDQEDGDGGLETAEVEKFLREKLTAKSLSSFCD